MSAPDSVPHQGLTVSKRARACDFCRLKKIRCIGAHPCDNCIEHEESCIFSERQRRKKRRTHHDLARRLAEFESFLDAAREDQNLARIFVRNDSSQDIGSEQTQVSNARSCGRQDEPPSSNPGLVFNDILHSAPVGREHSPEAVPVQQRQSQTSPRDWERREIVSEASPKAPKSFTFPYTPTQPSTKDTSGYETVKTGIEYWGPRTNMALCSKPGIAWVKARVKQPDFEAIASQFALDLAKRLKMDKRPSAERRPEPSLDVALQFSRAHFEEGTQASLGILQRRSFETRLRSFLSGSQIDDDPAWYALRNTVYASGCRIEVSKRASFREAQQQSWAWFENALSVHSELLFCHTSLTGVQALALMAYVVESISCPILQYMLCANALRLAVTQGLHRHPIQSWNLPEDEVSIRNCTFWALYCLDKDLAWRAGRPSTMEDDDITCQVPPSIYFQALVRISRLSSIAYRKLASASALQSAPEEWVNNVVKMDNMLEELRHSLKDTLNLHFPLDLANIPTVLNSHEAVSLQFLFYTLTWDIHSALAHPWCRDIFNLDKSHEYRSQIDRSSKILAETSKTAILECRFVHCDANCSLVKGYYTPLYAVINLFVSILQNLASTSPSDLTLMDVGAGHFARLSFATESDFSVPLVKNLSLLANNALEAFRTQSSQSSAIAQLDTEGTPLSVPFVTTQEVVSDTFNEEHLHQDWLDTSLNEDFEMWSIFYPGGPESNLPDQQLYEERHQPMP
ncbi:hypothetical protein RBB50_007132 [Rhinocladiella similis]